MSRAPFALVALAVALGACRDEDPAGAELVPPSAAPLHATLTRAADCADLAARLRADLVTHARIEAWTAFGHRPTSGVEPFPVQDAAIGFPGAPSEGDGLGSGGSPRGHTDTNTQVEGVDEVDFVETDGEAIYLLHGDTLFVLDAWPPSETSIRAQVDIEGSALGLFVEDGRAVVISATYPYAGGAEPFPGAGEGDRARKDSRDAGTAPEPASPGPRVKVTTLDVAPATPTVIGERWIEGTFVDARRHGDVVRVLVASQPYGDLATPSLYGTSGRPLSADAAERTLGQWVEDVQTELAARAVADLVPAVETRVAGGDVVRVAQPCTDYFLPEPGSAALGMLSVASVRLSDAGFFAGTTIVGRADTVYANLDTLVVAQNDYRFTEFGGIAQQEVALHAFALEDASTAYVASGKTPGSVSGQFAMDVRDDVLRIALTEDRVADGAGDGRPTFDFPPTTPVSYVATLGITQEGLVGIGRTVDLAPGERLQSVRFLGDRAYLVTFLRVDPLFVVDVFEPTTLEVLAELKIPGFSEYVHPLAPGYLLTIGRDVDEVTGVDRGMAISIFDVRDDTSPALRHKRVLEGYSNAEHDHHDFVFDAGHGLLAIPFYDYTNGFSSELALFSIDVEGGIGDVGRIDHASLFDDCVDDESYDYPYYGCGYSPSVRRGLFIDDFVYSISYGGVRVHALGALTDGVASVPLPAPTFHGGGYYYYWD